MPPQGEPVHDNRRGAAHLVEQLSISLDKAKVALAECCTDGSPHAALSLALFQQAISKLDETRYMVRRSLDEAKRSERPSPEQQPHRRKSHQDKAVSQTDSTARQNDLHSVNRPPDPFGHERFPRDRAARKEGNSSSAGGLGAPVLRPGDRFMRDSVSPDRHSADLSAQAVVRPSSAASAGRTAPRRDAPPLAFSTRPPVDAVAKPASPPFLGITKTLSPQPIEVDLKGRALSARSRSAHSEGAADEELQSARNNGVRRGSMVRQHRTPPKDSERNRARSSSRVRRSSLSSETSLSGEDEIPPVPKTHSTSSRRKTPDESQGDLSRVVPSQRVWKRGPAPPSRRAFDLASAPPQSDDKDEDVEHADLATLRRVPTSLRGERVATAIVAAASAYSASERLDLLRSLALVSREYRQVAQAELFRDIHLTKSSQLDLLVPVVENNVALASAVKALSLTGLGPGKRSRSEFLDQIRRLLAPLHHLESLDENLLIPDWDIVDYDYKEKQDYILSPASRCRLKSLRSASAWWEISALHGLFTDQRELESVIIGGAVVDREWASSKLMTLASPAKSLKRLEVTQVLHEDTLLVLLTTTGGNEGSLCELNLGFQSIDEETPRASIVSAFRSAGQGLKQLTLHAPSQVSEDLTGFLDEIVAELPQLESIEWSENSTAAARIPLASARFLEHLPTNLRRLQAHDLVSLSTSKVLAMLEEPEKVPSLAELEIEWATGRGDERGREPWYRERHIARIEDAAAELGIACRVGKSKEEPTG